MSSSFTVGQTQFLTGFCTHAFLLRGKSLSDLEGMLGYRPGRLASGATVLFLEQLPGPDDFQLAGYTYFSDGALQGHKLDPKDRDQNRMEALLKSEHGMSDDHTPIRESYRLADAAKRAWAEFVLDAVPGADHLYRSVTQDPSSRRLL